MDSVKTYDRTNKGVLFKNTDEWTISHTGKINVDGEDKRIIGVKRKNKLGEEILETYVAMGTLKKKQKNKETDPDAQGVANVFQTLENRLLSGWNETSMDGNKRLTLSLRKFEGEKLTPPSQPSESLNQPNTETKTKVSDLDDEIPF